MISAELLDELKHCPISEQLTAAREINGCLHYLLVTRLGWTPGEIREAVAEILAKDRMKAQQ